MFEVRFVFGNSSVASSLYFSMVIPSVWELHVCTMLHLRPPMAVLTMAVHSCHSCVLPPTCSPRSSSCSTPHLYLTILRKSELSFWLKRMTKGWIASHYISHIAYVYIYIYSFPIRDSCFLRIMICPLWHKIEGSNPWNMKKPTKLFPVAQLTPFSNSHLWTKISPVTS